LLLDNADHVLRHSAAGTDIMNINEPG